MARTLKQAYIDMRLSGVYEDNWFHQYYLSKGGVITDKSRFSILFLKYSTNLFEKHQDINFILGYLDDIFGLTLVVNNNKIIKIIQ